MLTDIVVTIALNNSDLYTSKATHSFMTFIPSSQSLLLGWYPFTEQISTLFQCADVLSYDNLAFKFPSDEVTISKHLLGLI